MVLAVRKLGPILAGALLLVGLGLPQPGTASPSDRTCVAIAPVTADQIQTIMSTPVAATPVKVDALLAGAQPLEGIEPEIGATIEMLFDCLNRGKTLSAYSLYSDSYLRSIVTTEGGFDQQLFELKSTPSPTEGEGTVVLAITNPVQLADGRLGVTVVLQPVLIPVEKRFFFIFTKSGDRWLVDGVISELDLELGAS